MPRAKSRLERQKKIASLNITSPKNNSVSLNSNKKLGKRLISGFTFLAGLIGNYFRHLPALISGLFFVAVDYYILTKINPGSIQHFILPNSYLPFLLVTFLSLFFLVSFFLLNSRRGFFIALAVTIFLFFRIQQVLLTNELIVIILLPLLALEVVYILVKQRS